MIARCLRQRGVWVTFGYRVPHSLLQRAGIKIFPISDIEINDFSSNVFAAYTPELIEQAVQDELAAIKQFRPDVVVGDFRLTAAISSRLAGLPYVSVVNAYMTEVFDPVDVVMPHGHGRTIASMIGGLLYSGQKRAVAKPFRSVARRHGIKDLNTLFDFLTGERTLIADLPEFCPLKKLPSEFHYIGPLIWEGQEESMPDILSKRSPNKQLLYVTTGNTGSADLLNFVADSFANHPSYDVLMTTGAFIDPATVRRAPNISVHRFMPGSEVLHHADAIIHTGGNGTTYQAIAAGVPAIVIPFNNDQKINAWLAMRNGVGKSFSPAGLTGKQIFAALHELREDSTVHHRLALLAARIAESNAPDTAASHIQAVAAGNSKT
ncbi:MAG: hypothetical protein GY799_21560 [Desulfobulbaceae bacterium]|nr:hypothetical protein [Desulfobulbaceae bacterium]